MIEEPKVFENSNLSDADLLVQVALVRAVNALLKLHGLESIDWNDPRELVGTGFGHVLPPLTPGEKTDTIADGGVHPNMEDS